MKIALKSITILFLSFLAFAAFDTNPLSLTPYLIAGTVIWLTYSVCADLSKEHEQDMLNLNNLD